MSQIGLATFIPQKEQQRQPRDRRRNGAPVRSAQNHPYEVAYRLEFPRQPADAIFDTSSGG